MIGLSWMHRPFPDADEIKDMLAFMHQHNIEISGGVSMGTPYGRVQEPRGAALVRVTDEWVEIKHRGGGHLADCDRDHFEHALALLVDLEAYIGAEQNSLLRELIAVFKERTSRRFSAEEAQGIYRLFQQLQDEQTVLFNMGEPTEQLPQPRGRLDRGKLSDIPKWQQEGQWVRLPPIKRLGDIPYEGYIIKGVQRNGKYVHVRIMYAPENHMHLRHLPRDMHTWKMAPSRLTIVDKPHGVKSYKELQQDRPDPGRQRTILKGYIGADVWFVRSAHEIVEGELVEVKRSRAVIKTTTDVYKKMTYIPAGTRILVPIEGLLTSLEAAQAYQKSQFS